MATNAGQGSILAKGAFADAAGKSGICYTTNARFDNTGKPDYQSQLSIVTIGPGYPLFKVVLPIIDVVLSPDAQSAVISGSGTFKGKQYDVEIRMSTDGGPSGSGAIDVSGGTTLATADYPDMLPSYLANVQITPAS